jgi:hypothetical protein
MMSMRSASSSVMITTELSSTPGALKCANIFPPLTLPSLQP